MLTYAHVCSRMLTYAHVCSVAALPADRSAYDLTVHSERTKVALEAQDKLETPISVEVVALAKKAGALMGKDFRTDAPIVKGFLESLSPADARALQAEVEAAGRALIEP